MCYSYFKRAIINVLTEPFLLFTNVLFKMLEYNPLCYKKKAYVKT